MRKAVEVRVGKAVILHAVDVPGRFVSAKPTDTERVLERVGVEGVTLGVEVERHRNGHAVSNQPHGPLSGFLGDQVEGPELVVLTPAAPVRELFQPRLELRHAHRRCGLCGRIFWRWLDPQGDVQPVMSDRSVGATITSGRCASKFACCGGLHAVSAIVNACRGRDAWP